MSCEILMIRHGKTEWNKDKRLQGHTDIPLSKMGISQVKEWQIPKAFQNWQLYSSPLQRAQQTSQLIFPDQKAQIEPTLIEMSFGDWEGEQLQQLRKKLGQKMQVMEDLGLDFQPPNGESPRTVQTRLLPFLINLAKTEENTIMICHKAVIRAIYAAGANWDMKTKPAEKLLTDSAHLFCVENNGDIRIVQMNIPLTQNLTTKVASND